MNKTDLKTFVSDKLISTLGYSKPLLVHFVLALSKQASSRSDFLAHLVDDFGLSPSNELSVFAQEIFDKVPHRGSSGFNLYQIQEREARLFVKKHKSNKVLEDEGDDGTGDGVVNNPKKRFRKKTENHEDGNYEIDEKRRVKRRSCKSSDDGDRSDSEEERRLDREERDRLAESIIARDKLAKSKRLSRNKKEKDETIERSIEELREISRQKYLKDRVPKKLQEMRDEIEDEQYMFQGVKLTEKEYRRIRRKKEYYALVKKQFQEADDDDLGEYKIPEAYDQEGRVDQEKRFAVALKGYKEASARGERDLLPEHEAWEEAQIRKGTLKCGAQDRKRNSDDYQLVFDDPIEPIKAEGRYRDGAEDEMVAPLERSFGKLAFEKVQNEREALPIYPLREKLLKAVNDHQILIIVGETGSGKTTQIPQYLHEAGYTRRGKIGCTQPCRVAAISIAARVAGEMGVKLGDEVGFSIRFEECISDKTILKYMTDGMLLKEFLGEPDLASYSVVILDEAHERTVPTDILFGLLKDLARFRPDLKLLISSATLDADKFSDFFDCAPIFKIPGRRYPVDIYFTKDPESDYMDAAIRTALQIHRKERAGDILIFLTGQDEIETADEILKEKMRVLGSKAKELIIYQLYSGLPTEFQTKIFRPTPDGSRKVVLATNIAETSLTIDGIKYVIDTGFCKLNSCSPRTGTESLLVHPISKASAMQRAGRAGRTGPGKCYRLYTAHSYKHDFDENTSPEIQRKNLADVVLTLKMLGVSNLIDFDFMDPPPTEALFKALELLFSLGALSKTGELTTLGRRMAEFPLEPMLSKMVVASDKYKCSEEIITIAAMLSVGSSIFYFRRNKRIHAENAKKNFYRGNVGDHIALLNVYNAWKESNYWTQWCYENYVLARSMRRARDIRDQLESLMDRVEIEPTSNPNDLEAIKKAITSGFFPNAARLQQYPFFQTVKHPQTARVHPGSGLSGKSPSWVVYHELVLTSDLYMRQVTEIKKEWLIEVAPHYLQLNHLGSK